MSYDKSYVTTEQVSSSSTVFAKLMRNVYSWMALALLITALTAMVVAQHPDIVYTIGSNRLYTFGLIGAELGLVLYLTARIHKMSFLTAGLMFALYSILNGVTMSFIFFAYTMTSIAQTFFITAGTFAAMSLVGYVVKKDLSTMGRFLVMLLIGIIIASVVNIFVGSSALEMGISYLGVLVFVGLTAYDTQKIKLMLVQASQHGYTDETSKLALMGSLSLYLDFINLFLYLLRIFGNRR
ncbi:MAG: Bax inhibitor-1/YccA family protein [Bacteroidales bacterium]|nr:Bax inhibitor-1/YccA family protein [Bacteroidales bacterium]